MTTLPEKNTATDLTTAKGEKLVTDPAVNLATDPASNLATDPAAANPTPVQEIGMGQSDPVHTTDMAHGLVPNAAKTSLPTSVPEESKNLLTSTEKVLQEIQKNVNLGKENEESDASGSSSAVFVSVLVAGLLLAATIVDIFYLKRHRQTNGKGMKLAEESYMADEENQGNTLVSVAPLNQPEPQEKPSLNGESQEPVKAQTPPAATNGHSTTKTADTEL
ncbi:uncharacterized protein LOC122329250 [Puntigrus tetrazona]|uniref:uncharacterized protein LOC122329250 n=1 Tax=Puntigrus tetrazona TaxID=1606681 RepID=UPI001C88FD04|nr:uncharacterized protein LOC122329250 [Puntigrus tetrazona]